MVYESTVALLIPEPMLSLADVSLPAGVLPFVTEREKFPSETQLLALLQESGSQVIFYSGIVSKGTRDAAALLNETWQRLYGCDAVLIAADRHLGSVPNGEVVRYGRVAVSEPLSALKRRSRWCQAASS